MTREAQRVQTEKYLIFSPRSVISPESSSRVRNTVRKGRVTLFLNRIPRAFAGSFRARTRMQLWQVVLAARGVRPGYRSVR